MNRPYGKVDQIILALVMVLRHIVMFMGTHGNLVVADSFQFDSFFFLDKNLALPLA